MFQIRRISAWYCILSMTNLDNAVDVPASVNNKFLAMLRRCFKPKTMFSFNFGQCRELSCIIRIYMNVYTISIYVCISDFYV